MQRSIDEIAAKINALGLWTAIQPYSWAVQPRDSIYPYFCMAVPGDGKVVVWRILMLKGWQTLHDNLHLRVDPSYGFISSPVEMPHYELVVLASGAAQHMSCDVGLRPFEIPEAERPLVAKILWQTYGIMLRVETDGNLLMRFFENGALFSRAERADGSWADDPLKIIPAKPHVENVTLAKDLLKRAADLPLIPGERIALDFRLMPRLQLNYPPRPRTIYGLIGIDARGNVVVDNRVSPAVRTGLREIWEAMPGHLLQEFVRRGKLPGELRLVSARVFRLLRPLCDDLPIRLTLKDALPELDAAYDRAELAFGDKT